MTTRQELLASVARRVTHYIENADIVEAEPAKKKPAAGGKPKVKAKGKPDPKKKKKKKPLGGAGGAAPKKRGADDDEEEGADDSAQDNSDEEAEDKEAGDEADGDNKDGGGEDNADEEKEAETTDEEIKNAPEPKKLGKKPKAWWDSLSAKEQRRYLSLKEGSIFNRLPLKDMPPEEPKAEEGGDAAAAPEGGDNSEAKPEEGLVETREMSDQEREAATARIGELEQEGALDPESKEREMSAAVIEQEGAEALKELSDEDKAAIAEEFNAAKGGIDEDEAREIRREEREEARRAKQADEKRRSNNKKLALGAGLLIAGALIGIGLAVVSPGVALAFGQQFVGAMPSLIQALQGKDVDPVEADLMLLALEQGDGDLDEFVKVVAEYVRRGDLPQDALEQLKSMVNKPA